MYMLQLKFLNKMFTFTSRFQNLLCGCRCWCRHMKSRQCILFILIEVQLNGSTISYQPLDLGLNYLIPYSGLSLSWIHSYLVAHMHFASFSWSLAVSFSIHNQQCENTECRPKTLPLSPCRPISIFTNNQLYYNVVTLHDIYNVWIVKAKDADKQQMIATVQLLDTIVIM